MPSPACGSRSRPSPACECFALHGGERSRASAAVGWSRRRRGTACRGENPICPPGALAPPRRQRRRTRRSSTLRRTSSRHGHARLLAMLISLHSFGSIQTLRTPQFSTDAASRFCNLSEMPIVSYKTAFLAQPATRPGGRVKGRSGLFPTLASSRSDVSKARRLRWPKDTRGNSRRNWQRHWPRVIRIPCVVSVSAAASSCHVTAPRSVRRLLRPAAIAARCSSSSSGSSRRSRNKKWSARCQISTLRAAPLQRGAHERARSTRATHLSSAGSPARGSTGRSSSEGTERGRPYEVESERHVTRLFRRRCRTPGRTRNAPSSYPHSPSFAASPAAVDVRARPRLSAGN